MVSINLEKAAEEAVQKAMEKQKEFIRQMREVAWDEGYLAGKQHDPRLPSRNTWANNPYRKVNPDAST